MPAFAIYSKQNAVYTLLSLSAYHTCHNTMGIVQAGAKVKLRGAESVESAGFGRETPLASGHKTAELAQ